MHAQNYKKLKLQAMRLMCMPKILRNVNKVKQRRTGAGKYTQKKKKKTRITESSISVRIRERRAEGQARRLRVTIKLESLSTKHHVRKVGAITRFTGSEKTVPLQLSRHVESELYRVRRGGE